MTSTPRTQHGKKLMPPGVSVETSYLKAGEARHRTYVNRVLIGTYDTLREAEKAALKRLAEMAVEKAHDE
jgi:hypothetical protein